jgi:deoxyribodipyrimidine photolyase
MNLEALKADARVTVRRDGPPDPDGRCVLYWMQRAQRSSDNPALDVAVAAGNALGLPAVERRPTRDGRQRLHARLPAPLDGRDPNGYAGVAWAIGGKHDRAWGPERPIFGKIRYMSFASTSRRFDSKAYMARVAALAPADDGGGARE